MWLLGKGLAFFGGTFNHLQYIFYQVLFSFCIVESSARHLRSKHTASCGIYHQLQTLGNPFDFQLIISSALFYCAPGPDALLFCYFSKINHLSWDWEREVTSLVWMGKGTWETTSFMYILPFPLFFSCMPHCAHCGNWYLKFLILSDICYVNWLFSCWNSLHLLGSQLSYS